MATTIAVAETRRVRGMSVIIGEIAGE